MITKVGQVISVDVTVYNKSNKTATSVWTDIKLPNGLSYVSHSLPVGELIVGKPLKWFQERIAANTAATITLRLKVDVLLESYKIKQYVTANEKDIDMSNNCKTLTLDISNCSVAPCVPGTPSDPLVIINDWLYSPIVGSLPSNNNVNCGCCITKYKLSDDVEPGNPQNFVITKFNEANGDWEGYKPNQLLPWSFDYRVLCLACPDGQQFEYGPKTISGSVEINNFITVVNNDYTVVSGDQYIFVDTTNTNVNIEVDPAIFKYELTIKKISNDSNIAYIVPTSGTIDTEAQHELLTLNSSVKIITDGLDFYITASHI